MVLYNIHGIIRVKSYFGEYLPRFFKTSSSIKTPDMIIYPYDFLKKKYDHVEWIQISPQVYYAHVNDEALAILSRKVAGIEIASALKSLDSNPTEVFINRNYRIVSKFLVMPISSLRSLTEFITTVIHVKLILRGFSFITGACFRPSTFKRAVLLSSLGRVGKTTTSLRILMRVGGEFFSDDKVIIDGIGNVYSYPSALLIRKGSLPSLDIIIRPSPERYFAQYPTVRLGKTCKIGMIVFLERGKDMRIIQIDAENAFLKMRTITDIMVPQYLAERLIVLYSYIKPDFNIYELRQQEIKLIEEFVRRADQYVILRCPYEKPHLYSHLLEELIRDYEI